MLDYLAKKYFLITYLFVSVFVLMIACRIARAAYRGRRARKNDRE